MADNYTSYFLITIFSLHKGLKIIFQKYYFYSIIFLGNLQ